MSRLELVNPEGFRKDGRTCNQIRCINIEFGVNPLCQGSSRYQQGLTEVVACVAGPMEPLRRNDGKNDRAVVSCDFRMGPFAMRDRAVWKKTSRNTKRMEQLISRTFSDTIFTELFSRSEIRISIEVLQNAGNLEGACINAVSLALVDAGIPMRDFVIACTSGIIDEHIAIDLNQIESSGSSHPELLVAMNPSSQSIVGMELRAALPKALLEDVMDMAIKGCSAIHEAIRDAVEERCLEQQVCV